MFNNNNNHNNSPGMPRRPATEARDRQTMEVPHMAAAADTPARVIATAIEGHPVPHDGFELIGHLHDTEIGAHLTMVVPQETKVHRMVTDLPATAEDQEMTATELVTLGFTLGSVRPLAESARRKTRLTCRLCRSPLRTASIG